VRALRINAIPEDAEVRVALQQSELMAAMEDALMAPSAGRAKQPLRSWMEETAAAKPAFRVVSRKASAPL
jgi:hypothetical protein